MKLSFPRFALPALLLTVAASASVAQAPGSPAPQDDLYGLKVVEVHPAPTPTPFPLDVSTGRAQSLEFRTPDAMTQADRDLAAASEPEIARRAALQGFNLNNAEGRGAWGYEQAVCPAFPDHLLLEYSRSNGTGDVTLFSAVVPRLGTQEGGHVRVIPVQRRSYSLFTPVSSNALTLNDFNHMVHETPTGISPDWLTLSLCYAALAGGHVRAELKAAVAADEAYPLLIPATLEVSRKGGAVVHYADATPPKTAPVDWALTFAQNGHLLKVIRKASRQLVEKPIKGNAEEVKGVPEKYPGLVANPSKTGN